MSLRDSYDTFLHFLADNLNGIAVHPVRRDPTNASGDTLQMNCLNVQVLNVSPNVHVGILQVSLDVVNDTELTAIDWVDQIWTLLSAALMTPKNTYTSGSAVQLTSNIYWKTSARFRKVHSQYYAHYTCQLTINTSNF